MECHKRAMQTPSRTTDPDPTRTYLVRSPQTRHSSHRSNFTNPHFSFPLHDHSFIHSHACIHTFIHLSINPYIHPSIAYAIATSQRFASRHEAVVVSFDMSDNRPRFEGQPTKGSRPPRINRARGENIDELQWPLPNPLRSG